MTGHQTAMFNMFQDGRTEVVCDRFEILDNSRKLLFFAESNEIGLKLDNLRILGMVLAMVFQLLLDQLISILITLRSSIIG